MKLTNKQQKELDVLLWFGAEPIAEEIKVFFERSTKGLHKDLRWEDNSLMIAKRNRDLQVAMWMEDWGDTLNAWSFLDEPQFIVEWIAEKLDRPAIVWAWHDAHYRWWNPFSWKHKKIAQSYQQTMDGRQNKSLEVRRSD